MKYGENAIEQPKVFSRDGIKYMAMAAMLLNHFAYIFMVPGSLLRELLLSVGYMTAPVMIYFLIEGYEHTSSRKAYLRRMFLFGIFSQLPFSLAFTTGKSISLCRLNMMFTLCLCFGVIYVIKEVTDPFRKKIYITALFLLSFLCDWAIFAPAFTLIFFNGKNSVGGMKKAFQKGAFLFGIVNFAGEIGVVPILQNMLFSLLGTGGIWLAEICILVLYNGKRAEKGQTFSKWFFYLFYPLHLLLLGMVRILLMK